MRVPYICLGWLMMTLGVIGVFVPLMPTTIFIILASWFFTRSSPRLENWLLNHPRFGATLRSWHATGAVPRSAKLMACAGMSTGFAIFWVGAHPQPWLAGLVGAAMPLLLRSPFFGR